MAREKAERLLANAENWERGAEGEARTAEILAGLGPEWALLHDLSWPGRRYANIDHVAIGPTGVFVIDSKNWSGSITVRHDVLRQNGYGRGREVAGCAEAALAVGRLVPEFMAMCHPVLCFVHNGTMRGTVGGVTLCSTTSLIATITSGPAVLDVGQAAQLAETLRTRLSPKSSGQAPARGRSSRRPATPPRRTRPTRRRRRSPLVALLKLMFLMLSVVIVFGLVSTLGQNISNSVIQPTPGATSNGPPPAGED